MNCVECYEYKDSTQFVMRGRKYSIRFQGVLLPPQAPVGRRAPDKQSTGRFKSNKYIERWPWWRNLGGHRV